MVIQVGKTKDSYFKMSDVKKVSQVWVLNSENHVKLKKNYKYKLLLFYLLAHN